MTQLKSNHLPKDDEHLSRTDILILVLFALGVSILIACWMQYFARPADAHFTPPYVPQEEPYCSPTQEPTPTETVIPTMTPIPTVAPSPTAGASAVIMPLAAPDTSLRQ